MSAVEVAGLVKAYRRVRGGKGRLQAMLGLMPKLAADAPRALDGVNVRIERGESVGLIGRNGSGKSTLLKILARVSPPTAGTVRIDGSVAALLELGTGFHPDFSGRENLRHAALLAGLEPSALPSVEEEIVAFAELAHVIDQPIRTYSAGMQMRLGFAVATSVRADILLVDEILAVGDAYFTIKCYERLKRFATDGGTFILVTHDLSSVLRMCDRAVWLEKGVVAGDGPADQIVDAYQKRIIAEEEGRALAGDHRAITASSPSAPIAEARVSVGDGARVRHHFLPGEPLQVAVTLAVRAACQARVRLLLRRRDNLCLADVRSEPLALAPGTRTVTAAFAGVALGPQDLFWALEVEVDGQVVLASGPETVTGMLVIGRPSDMIDRGAIRQAPRWTSLPPS